MKCRHELERCMSAGHAASRAGCIRLNTEWVILWVNRAREHHYLFVWSARQQSVLLMSLCRANDLHCKANMHSEDL